MKHVTEPVEEYYDRLARPMGAFSWYDDDDMLARIANLLPNYNLKVLELCCGGGQLLDAISRGGSRELSYVGVDISEKMVELATNRLEGNVRTRILRGDWVSPLGRGEHFDVIIVKNALHLIPQLARRLSELGSFLVPGGIVLIAETISPNAEVRGFVKGLFGILDPNSPKLHYFTSRSLLSLLHQCGLKESRNERCCTVDQFIDVRRWLKQKARSRSCLIGAQEHLAHAPLSVRQAMCFDNEELFGLPRIMLRRQVIVRLRDHSALRVRPRLDSTDQLRLPYGEREFAATPPPGGNGYR